MKLRSAVGCLTAQRRRKVPTGVRLAVRNRGSAGWLSARASSSGCSIDVSVSSDSRISLCSESLSGTLMDTRTYVDDIRDVSACVCITNEAAAQGGSILAFGRVVCVATYRLEWLWPLRCSRRQLLDDQQYVAFKWSSTDTSHGVELHLLRVIQIERGESRRQPREAPRDGALYLGHGHVLVLHMQLVSEHS